MAGNVWEWCEDLDGSSRVIRGGSWNADASITRAAYRYNLSPVNRVNLIGFRVVKTEEMSPTKRITMEKTL
jgi:formylglycine-generating enzyme required for sulfatase activity